MYLTCEEQKMLDGEYGAVIQESMKVLVTLGKINGAERMIEISNVHTPGVSYRVTGNAGLNYIKNASQNDTFRIPATLNTIGIDCMDWETIGFSQDFAQKQIELCACYHKLGAIAMNTCTPYLTGNVPAFGEHIAWGESSAIVFANSVLGARTNREGGPTALAAALVGRVPAYGLHLDENRKGTYLVRVEKKPKTDRDFAVLGYFTGSLVGQGVPVFEGIEERPSPENLKTLGAALASSGAVALYHIIGHTPEAPTKEAVLPDAQAVETVCFDQAAYDKVCEKFSLDGPIDFVVIGCPHASIIEVKKMAELLQGKTVKSGMWICTSRQVKQLADTQGYSEIILASGAEIICDTCPVLCETLSGRNYKTVATNSGKMAHYAPGLWQLKSVLLTMENCVKTAIDGYWGG